MICARLLGGNPIGRLVPVWRVVEALSADTGYEHWTPAGRAPEHWQTAEYICTMPSPRTPQDAPHAAPLELTQETTQPVGADAAEAASSADPASADPATLGRETNAGGESIVENLVLLPVERGPVALTEALCNIESVSGNEAAIADAIEQVLRGCAHLEVTRLGNNVIARTMLGRTRRVVVAGHIDTVPLAGNLPVRRTVIEGTDVLWGRGTVDMKAGVAVQLALAVELTSPRQDVTWCFYDNEEVAADLNGLGVVARTRPDLLEGDFAILGEPSNAGIEGGCNGTLRAVITTYGTAAHSARAWMGKNAIHGAHEILARLDSYEPQTITVDGLDYREGLNAVAIAGGIAGNVIPDRCEVTVNFRFAPSRSLEQAEAHVREVFSGFELEVTDGAAGARPGLDDPLALEFSTTVLGLTGGSPAPKYGWTDVARFSALGVAAVNFGPGDPMYAHKDDEHCEISQITVCYEALKSWLK